MEDERRFPVPAPPGGHALRRPSPPPWQRDTAEPSRRHDNDLPASFLPIHDEVSAGGVVIRQNADRFEAAIIARRNRFGRREWCLPKGHLEGEETSAQAAIREISEETGITGSIVEVLGTIDYWFTGTDRRVHKVVHHFLLTATSGTLSVEGDPDAEADEAAWVPVAELEDRLSYPNERRIARMAAIVTESWTRG